MQLTDRSALFLDRDGVINRRIIGGYVAKPEQFTFLPGVLQAIPILNTVFKYLFIATNQQGIGKGLFSEQDLRDVHQFMLRNVNEHGGRIDHIFFSPHLDIEQHPSRKPGIGMALEAKALYPSIDLSSSIMVGDSIHDLEFGRNAGMSTVFIRHEKDIFPGKLADQEFPDLLSFAKSIRKDPK
jgi:histidinol-phosphate phosphatase family protein